MYTILPYTFHRAKQLGVTVKPSTLREKKIDVFKSGKKVASVGAVGYMDYPTFLKKHGASVANARRQAYKKRHEKDRHIRNSPGFYADQLLW